MALLNGDVELTPIERLVEHPKNPRRGDVERIAESIRLNGFFGAVLAQRSSGRVLVGNHRLRAAGSAGLAAVPVIWLDVDDDRAEAIMVADNRASDGADYDLGRLTELLADLDANDLLADAGFSDAEFASLRRELARSTLEGTEVKPSSDQSKRLRDKFMVLITCDDEKDQLELLERLTVDGFNCRALTG